MLLILVYLLFHEYLRLCLSAFKHALYALAQQFLTHSLLCQTHPVPELLRHLLVFASSSRIWWDSMLIRQHLRGTVFPITSARRGALLRPLVLVVRLGTAITGCYSAAPLFRSISKFLFSLGVSPGHRDFHRVVRDLVICFQVKQHLFKV